MFSEILQCLHLPATMTLLIYIYILCRSLKIKQKYANSHQVSIGLIVAFGGIDINDISFLRYICIQI